jgi:hypothetical protein
MKYDIELSEDDTFIQTFGGECHIDGYDFKDYGIQIGAVTVTQLNPKQYMDLGVSIINHLMINGHYFKILNDKDGNGDYIVGILNQYETAV